MTVPTSMKSLVAALVISLRAPACFVSGQASTEPTWGYQPNSEICTLDPPTGVEAIHDSCVSNDLAPISFRVFAAGTMAQACPEFQPSDCNYGTTVDSGNYIPNWEFRATIENCGGSTRPSAGLQGLLGVRPTPALVDYCVTNGYGTPPEVEIFPQVFCHDSSNPLFPDGVLGDTCGATAEEFPLGDFFLVCGYQYVVSTGSIMYWSTASFQDTCDKFQLCSDFSPKCNGLMRDYIIELPCGDAEWCTNEPLGPTPAPAAPPTPAPIAPATPAPVTAPEPASTGLGGCQVRQRRHLQTLQEKWRIGDEPTFLYDSLAFQLNFEISDWITQDDMIRYELLDESCTVPYTGSGLTHSKGILSYTTPTAQEAPINIGIDSSVIFDDLQVYTDLGFINNQNTASVDFCVRFSLYTPAIAGEDEVNYLEVIVGFIVDLTDGFEIDQVNVEKLDPCEKEARDAFEVEGYFCEDGTENTPITETMILNQGQFVKVCVRPEPRGLDLGIRMRAIQSFTWQLDGSAIEQPAITNYQEASNRLTTMYCTSGYGVCHFESILFATFFTGPGVITGSGIADMQFGGESATSVSPKIQRSRSLREEPLPRRELQDTAASGVFALNAQLQQAAARTRDSGTNGSGFSWNMVRAATTLLLVGTCMLL